MNIISEDISKIIKNKRKLERLLNVKITIKGDEITIEGNAEDEYIAEKVINAVNFGFPIAIALLIREEDFLFEILDIKDYTHRKDLERIRARIIGKSGKTLKTLNNLTECNFEIKDNNVGIIGNPEYIKNAQDAVIFIIQGSKQANVYNYLEKHKVKPIVNLGLKERERRKE
jgi:KH domain-containing protein